MGSGNASDSTKRTDAPRDTTRETIACTAVRAASMPPARDDVGHRRDRRGVASAARLRPVGGVIGRIHGLDGDVPKGLRFPLAYPVVDPRQFGKRRRGLQYQVAEGAG